MCADDRSAGSTFARLSPPRHKSIRPNQHRARRHNPVSIRECRLFDAMNIHIDLRFLGRVAARLAPPAPPTRRSCAQTNPASKSSALRVPGKDAARACQAGPWNHEDFRAPRPIVAAFFDHCRRVIAVAQFDIQIVLRLLHSAAAQILRRSRDVACVRLFHGKCRRRAAAPVHSVESNSGPAFPCTTSASFHARLCASAIPVLPPKPP